MIDANDKHAQEQDASASDGEWTRLECAQLIRRLSTRNPHSERYAVLDEVGRGGMGRVLRVRDQDLHRDLAMKVMRDHLVARVDVDQEEVSPQLVLSARFIEEAQVAAQLDHPGIVPVHDVGLDPDGRLYFTMKLVRGRTLEKVLELAHRSLEGWSTTRVLNVLLRVCEAMSYAHDRGVLHRDIKPSNIMVGHHGEVYVMDWGLARLIGREPRAIVKDSDTGDVYSARHSSPGHGSSSPFVTEDGRILGTPAYMSPEQARCEPSAIRPTTDVYGVGALLYQALTARAPYSEPGQRADNRATCVALQSKAPEPIVSIAPRTAPELVSICEKAMARSVDERYPSMADLAEDLRAYLEMRVVRAHGSGPLVELRKWISRNKTMAGLLAIVVALVVTASLIVAVVEQRRAQAALMRADLHHAAVLKAAWPGLSSLPEHQAQRNAWLTDARRLAERASERRAELARAESAALASGAARLVDRPLDPELEDRITNESDAVLGIQRMLAKAHDFVPITETTSEQAQDVRDSLAILPAELDWHQSERARLESLREPDKMFVFAAKGEQTSHDDLLELSNDLTELGDVGILRVETLDARARDVIHRTLETDEAKDAWSSAAASIADKTRCPLYDGLAVVPQSGLLPLRRDPQSGLWEFWHVLSGKRPVALDSGGYAIEPDMGIVLVLVPGGVVTVGAQAIASKDELFDPDANKTESVRTARLDPYFLSKYEMTQGQWLCLTGTMPSEWNSGRSLPRARTISRIHPVEQITWIEARDALARWGLFLPTEMQFEHAERGGTTAAYGTSASFASLVGQVNYGDKRYQIEMHAKSVDDTVDDGFVLHAPVGSFAPNGYGLFDTIGNVSEWCRDWYADSCAMTPPRDGDGEVEPRAMQDKVTRGGGFRHAPADLRASRRMKKRPDRGADDVGARPARALDPHAERS